jgi:hypothetical protein
MKIGLALLLLVSSHALFGQSSPLTYISPDGKLRAIALPAHKAYGFSAPCLLEIRSSDGQLLAQEGHGGADARHRRRIFHGAWSPDSQFFAYDVTSSDARRFVTLVYVRRSEYRIYELNGFVVGRLADPIFSFSHGCRFHGRRLTRDGKVEDFAVDLSKIKWDKT